MPDYSIRDNCHVNSNRDKDTFVGIKSEDGQLSINFPLGYHVSEDEKGLRKDILLLLNTLSSTTDKTESSVAKRTRKQEDAGFPVQAYLFLISDFYQRGYYKEKEVVFTTSNRGKIDWNRTIKQQKPYVQGNNAFYLQFTTRKNPVKDNELITLVHEYCVYESFCKIGWLFTSALPQKPRIKFNPKLFKQIVLNKLLNTFNEQHKQLFSNMLIVIEHLQDPDAPKNYMFGVDPFDHTWEVLVDRVYGISGKEFYYPKTTWTLATGTFDNSELRPDSIMLWNGNVYVLDAKNYKFGKTKSPGDLPQSADINKQITYAEFISRQEKFKKIHGPTFTIYNAFIMPYDANLWGDDQHLHWIGSAKSEWKENEVSYEHVQGILVDVKYLMETAAQDTAAIMELAELIEAAATK